MIREMTNNGNNTRRPLCYLTARLSYAWTQRRTVTDKEGETDRETDRGTRGTEWDPICNTKPSKAAVVDDCHARITGRSGLNRAGPGRAVDADVSTKTSNYFSSCAAVGRDFYCNIASTSRGRRRVRNTPAEGAGKARAETPAAGPYRNIYGAARGEQR